MASQYFIFFFFLFIKHSVPYIYRYILFWDTFAFYLAFLFIAGHFMIISVHHWTIYWLLDQKDRIWIKQELKDLLKRGIIWESISPYSVVVNKKMGDRWMCIDYRNLNAKMKNSYPISQQTEIFTNFQGSYPST